MGNGGINQFISRDTGTYEKIKFCLTERNTVWAKPRRLTLRRVRSHHFTLTSSIFSNELSVLRMTNKLFVGF
jgi:hypothetical protein